jgi:hypothetical protein
LKYALLHNFQEPPMHRRQSLLTRGTRSSPSSRAVLT